VADVGLKRWGVNFASPVVLASGPAGFGFELHGNVPLETIGALTLKTITPQPRQGNPQPRLVDCPSGALNSIGLDNPGLDRFEASILPGVDALPTQIIYSIAAPSAEEIGSMAERLAKSPQVKLLELNLSCPNVEGGVIGADASAIRDYVRRVREGFDGVILAKLPGDAGDLLASAEAALSSGAEGITLINSLRGMRIDWTTGRPFLKSTFGGLCGPAILPIALARVYDVRRAFPEAVIVGTGGVVELGSLVEMLMAGADLVGIGFGLMSDPQVGGRLAAELGRWLDERGMPSVEEIIGVAQEPQGNSTEGSREESR